RPASIGPIQSIFIRRGVPLRQLSRHGTGVRLSRRHHLRRANACSRQPHCRPRRHPWTHVPVFRPDEFHCRRRKHTQREVFHLFQRRIAHSHTHLQLQ